MTDLPSDNDVATRVRRSFARQGMMAAIGATLGSVSPGRVTIMLRPGAANAQQNGFVHAGAVSAIANSAVGYAALTLMPPGRNVLTTEFKINLLAPATGDRLVAEGRIVKAGRTLTIGQAEVFAETGDDRTLVALLTATLIGVDER